MSTFTVTADHGSFLSVGMTVVRAVVRVRAVDIGESGIAVSLRLWTPRGATVAVLRQFSPAHVDLIGEAVALDHRTAEYGAGHWADGARGYELAVALPERAAGDEMLAARFSVVVAGEPVGGAPIAVTWTDDERLAATARSAGGVRPCATAEDLPTNPSPQPRHTLGGEASADQPCSGCGLRPQLGDRFCEDCGQPFGAGRPQ